MTLKVSNVQVRQRKNQPRRVYSCELCGISYKNYPYEITFVSVVGMESKTYTCCKKCCYKEAYGTKGMVSKMKDKIIEEKTD